MVELNDSAAEILNTIGEGASVESIITTLSNRYPDDDIKADILAFLNDALTENWLEYA